jgi:hypothetical protein
MLRACAGYQEVGFLFEIVKKIFLASEWQCLLRGNFSHLTGASDKTKGKCGPLNIRCYFVTGQLGLLSAQVQRAGIVIY